MPYKVCPSCQQSSYSACVSSVWLCPYCGKELTLCKGVYNRRRLPAQTEPAAAASTGSLFMFKRY